MVYWEVSIFWCLESVRRKQSRLSRFCQMGWLVSSQTGSRMEWAIRLTPEPHWAPRTHWNISIYPKTIPHIHIHSQDCIRRQQTLTDNRRFVSPCKIESIWSQTTSFAKPWKARLFSPDTFETSKYQNLPMYHFQKLLGFAIFCDFDTCHKEITIHSLFGSPFVISTLLSSLVV